MHTLKRGWTDTDITHAHFHLPSLGLCLGNTGQRQAVPAMCKPYCCHVVSQLLQFPVNWSSWKSTSRVKSNSQRVWCVVVDQLHSQYWRCVFSWGKNESLTGRLTSWYYSSESSIVQVLICSWGCMTSDKAWLWFIKYTSLRKTPDENPLNYENWWS